MILPPPRSTLFPYTTLFRSQVALLSAISNREITPVGGGNPIPVDVRIIAATNVNLLQMLEQGDRKSTRLNSSHITISYAVFCLKKKKKKIQNSLTVRT